MRSPALSPTVSLTSLPPRPAQVPVPHFGVCLTVPAFHKLARKLQKAKVSFLVEPHLRFTGAPGEQWTMFFKVSGGAGARLPRCGGGSSTR